MPEIRESPEEATTWQWFVLRGALHGLEEGSAYRWRIWMGPTTHENALLEMQEQQSTHNGQGFYVFSLSRIPPNTRALWNYQDASTEAAGIVRRLSEVVEMLSEAQWAKSVCEQHLINLLIPGAEYDGLFKGRS